MADSKDLTKKKISLIMTPQKARQFLLLGLLWFICSATVILAGAATCAVFYVGIKILNDDADIKPFRLFFKGVKQNFVQGLLMFLISVITIGGFGALVAWSIISDQSKLVILIALGCCYIAFVYSVFAYPIIARYENKFGNILKNTVALLFTYLSDALKLSLVLIIFIAIDVFLFRLNLLAGFLSLLFWPSVIFYAICYLMTSIFYKVEHPIKYDDNGDPIPE